MMKDKSKLIAIVLVIITVVVVALSTVFNKKDEEYEIKPEVVTNYSNFYTVNSCVYRVATYIASENKNDLMLVLSKDYQRKNKITEDNILELFPKVEQGSTFVSTKMYYENIDSNIKKYYVEGYIEANQLVEMKDSNNLERNEIYFIVYLDTKEQIFSIEPYDGNIFMDGETNEK